MWREGQISTQQVWRARSKWSQDLLPRGADDVAELIYLSEQDQSTTLLKDDRTTTVRVVRQPDQPNQQLVVKRYNAKGRWHKISRAIRESRASRCWRMSYVFAEAGISVATPYMMHEVRFGPFNQNAYFVSEKLAGQELLTALPKLEVAEQREVVASIKVLFEQLEEHRLSHGDMKASNILWNGEQLSLIDLDACAQHRHVLSWRKANLKDRKRFLKNWQERPELLSMFEFLA